MDVQMYFLCFSIMIQCIEDTFNYLENENCSGNIEYKDFKNEILDNIYKNNGKIDKNQVTHFREWELLPCLRSFDEQHSNLESLNKYLKIINQSEYFD